MITSQVRKYQFCGCELQLIGEKLFYVKIISQSPDWEMRTTIPKTCPFEALMIAELEVLKAQIKADLSPACIIQVSRGIERIVGFNRMFGSFNQEQLKNSALDIEEYAQVLELIRDNKKNAHIQLISEDGSLTQFMVELKKSSMSVVNWLLCRAIP